MSLRESCRSRPQQVACRRLPLRRMTLAGLRTVTESAGTYASTARRTPPIWRARCKSGRSSRGPRSFPAARVRAAHREATGGVGVDACACSDRTKRQEPTATLKVACPRPTHRGGAGEEGSRHPGTELFQRLRALVLQLLHESGIGCGRTRMPRRCSREPAVAGAWPNACSLGGRM